MSTPVKLRSLTVEEGRTLQRIRDRSRDPVARRRALILLAADTGLTPVQLHQQRMAHATYVRKVLHAFNERGLASVGAQYKGQKPLKFDEQVQKQIVDVVVTPPDHLGLPFGVWSLPKLRDYLIDQHLVESISLEHLRWLLKRKGISFQRTKTWKQSPDPDFDEKKNESGVSMTHRQRRTGG